MTQAWSRAGGELQDHGERPSHLEGAKWVEGLGLRVFWSQQATVACFFL